MRTHTDTEDFVETEMEPVSKPDKEKSNVVKKKVKKKSKKAKKVAKAKGAKKAVAKKASTKFNQGQGGPALELGVDKMNEGEAKIVKGIFTKKGERKGHTIKELQAFIDSKKDTSPTRNALRRLVRAGWVEKTVIVDAEGKKKNGYRLTEKGRKRGL